MTRVVVHADAEAVAQATAARLLVAIIDTLSVQDRAHVVLTGGTVGIATLSAVAASPLAGSVDWTSVHVWWGDERFVPAGDADRNEGQAQAAMLGALPLPEENIHRMGPAGAFATAEEAAQAYADELARAGDPEWDVAMFGMGPDGHVASLFPSHEVFAASVAAVEDEETGTTPRTLAVHDSPKPPPDRVTLTLAAINRAKRAWIVAAGAEKAEVTARALRGDTSLPVSWVRGTQETLWLIDAKAASRV